jgi:DNA polymerase-3 subunit alpha
MDFTAKVAEYIDECKKMGIKLIAPDVNSSFAAFTVSGKSIQFGLLAIKNVGRNTIDALVREREANGIYKGLSDFINRMSGKDLNKRCMESLIKAGAFDSMGGKRVQYMIAYKNIMNGAVAAKRLVMEGQINLFDLGGFTSMATGEELPKAPEYPLRELINYEKQVLGIYISGHPLSEHQLVLKACATKTSVDFLSEEEGCLRDNDEVIYGGIIIAKSVKTVKSSGKPMAFLTVEDMYGSVETVVFSQLFERHKERLDEDAVIVIKGKCSVKEDEVAKIIANDIYFYSDLLERRERFVLWLRIKKEKASQQKKLMDLLQANPGLSPVKIFDKEKRTLQIVPGVSLKDSFVNKLKTLLGEDSVQIKYTW